jgi:HAD superfamily phosphoserine phosphatase-like hydrolase
MIAVMEWLLVADVDGTLTTETSIWESFHKKLGKWETQGLVNLNAFLAGQIDYHEFAVRDARAYRGLTKAVLDRMAAEIPRRRGMERMLKTMARRGFTIALISTGLDILVDQIPGAQFRVSNRLEFENGVCTGRPIVEIPIGEKGTALKHILDTGAFCSERTVVIGDSSGDIPMMQSAGFSIAVAPSDATVLKYADAQIDGEDLMRIPALIEEYRVSVESRKPRTFR